MEITYIGHSSFKLKGKNATVITDPYDPDKTGLKFPKVTADVVTISHAHSDHNYGKGVDENELVVSGPGEYEYKGVKIFGISSFHDAENGTKRGKNTIYRFVIDKISIVHLGDLGHKLSEKQVDSLGDIDVLLIPVGGKYTITAQEAAAIVSQVEPKIIIPMHYKREGLNESAFGELMGVDQFLKEMGKSEIVPQPKLVLTKDKLPLESMVVVLE